MDRKLESLAFCPGLLQNGLARRPGKRTLVFILSSQLHSPHMLQWGWTTPSAPLMLVPKLLMPLQACMVGQMLHPRGSQRPRKWVRRCQICSKMVPQKLPRGSPMDKAVPKVPPNGHNLAKHQQKCTQGGPMWPPGIPRAAIL